MDKYLNLFHSSWLMPPKPPKPLGISEQYKQQEHLLL